MDITKKIHSKLDKMLKRLKALEVVESFILEINFFQIDDYLRNYLAEIDTVLKKCLKKIMAKPKKAEIRNIITEIVRKKNLNSLENPVEDDGNSNQCLTLSPSVEDLTHIEPTICEPTEIVFKCDICEAEFSSKNYLSAHLKIHNNDNNYLCHLCRKTFSDFWKLNKHRKRHFIMKKKEVPSHKSIKETAESLEILPDDEIEKNSILDGDNLFETNNTSTGTVEKDDNILESNNLENEGPSITDMKFTCKCGKMFKLLKSLKKHESVKHPANKINHTCTICKKSFTEIGKLNRHKLSHEIGRYQCSYCEKQFTRSDALRRHTSLVHFPQKSFPCNFCQKKFTLKFNRDVHEENTHKVTNREVVCDQCGQRFINKITCECVFRIHSDSQLFCDICGKSFDSKSYYNSHMKSKHLDSSSF